MTMLLPHPDGLSARDKDGNRILFVQLVQDEGVDWSRVKMRLVHDVNPGLTAIMVVIEED